MNLPNPLPPNEPRTMHAHARQKEKTAPVQFGTGAVSLYKGVYHISFIAAWAAARRAMGTRKGLQET